MQGEAGVMDLTGPRDGAPYKVGTAIGDPGIGALTAWQAGHLGRALRGQAHWVRVSVSASRCMRLWRPFIDLQRQHLFRHRPIASPSRQRAIPRIVPYETFEASGRLDQSGVRANDDLRATPQRRGAAGSATEDPPGCGEGVRPGVRNRGQRWCPLVRALITAAWLAMIGWGAWTRPRRAERRHPHRGRGLP